MYTGDIFRGFVLNSNSFSKHKTHINIGTNLQTHLIHTIRGSTLNLYLDNFNTCLKHFQDTISASTYAAVPITLAGIPEHKFSQNIIAMMLYTQLDRHTVYRITSYTAPYSNCVSAM